jgi:xanthine dehydrogenase accessory factor
MPTAGPAARPRAVIKGAGDLATGVALRLHHAGFAVVMTEIAMPTTVRRAVAFAEAVYSGSVAVEGVAGVRAALADIDDALAQRRVPVVVAEDAGGVLGRVAPALLVDAIMAKRNTGTSVADAPAVVALGPGFIAGRDAHAVVETNRGHDLGRVLLEGSAQADTGVPGDIGGYAWQRVVRSPASGVFRGVARIGDLVETDDVVGHVDDEPVRVALTGVVRGLLHDDVQVVPGFKVGDIDPRGERSPCFTVSDKARAIGGGVLEAACLLLGGAHFAPSPERGG